MSNSNSSYINLHINGIGFFNRVRMVKPQKGEPFMATTIALQEGEVVDGDYSNVNTTYVDCRVSGKKAKAILQDLVLDNPTIDQNTKVRAVVKIAGLEVNTFTYTKGIKEGQTGVSLKSRLLNISHLYIDGKQYDLSDYHNDPGNQQGDSDSPPITEPADVTVSEAVLT